MHPTSVPARPLEAGVTVVGGTATDIAYKVGHRLVTADLLVLERVTSAEPVLHYLHRHPDRRLLIV